MDHMTDKEFFVETMADEIPRFIRVLESVPNENLDYRPHPRSKSATELLQLFMGEPEEFMIISETGFLDFAKHKRPDLPNSRTVLIDLFEKNMDHIINVVKNLSSSDWMSEAKIVNGSEEFWKTTRRDMVWGLLLDLIHHRGQLSTYIRPMGGKVPSIYGPSGDTSDK